MRHLGEPYYVALLTAAQFHGAAHHKPQRFQVMVRKNRRCILRGTALPIEFIARHDLERTPIVELNTPTGRIRVSSPEATALEVAGHPRYCGGMDNVANTAAEISDVMDAKRLVAAARLCPLLWAQRLGYLLDLTGHSEMAGPLAAYVAEQDPAYVPLSRHARGPTGPRDTRWRLIVNETVEPDV